MNQVEQATSITGSDIDAAIQDERMVELEQRIERLEAALETWLIAVNYDDSATPPMNEINGGKEL